MVLATTVNSVKIAARKNAPRVMSMEPCCICGYPFQECECDGCLNGCKVCDDEDVKPAANAKIGANAKNPALTKNSKKEKKWHQTLSPGCIKLWSKICPIVSVKSLDSSINSKILVALDSHADTTEVGSNVW